ncbi:MAG: hypothetical protein FD165_2206 [Gammaproteobacteria bacterium]|nr:MAG: hypothetical protein FD165_2206 [Gammaproteobacteria bacterium]TND03270.1 MAG: hypothetical protein FD120_1943 [Gammaproteobacteria bacterium]
MVVRANGLISNAADLTESDLVTDDIVDVENLLPEDILDGNGANDTSATAPHPADCPRSRRRELEAYLEQKRLEEWLYDPLDDTSH